MDRFSRKSRIIAIVLIIFAVIAIAFFIYRQQRFKLLDRSAFDSFSHSITEAYDQSLITDQESLTEFITSWADENGIKYRVDRSGNIIFNRSAAKRKKNVSPTVICVSLNHKTAANNAELIASAAMIAASDIDSGRRTVIFFNNEDDSGSGYRNINSKYLSSNSKVIYMDKGGSSRMSVSSFAQQISEISIPAAKKKTKCDTAVKIHISGATTDSVGGGKSARPDPLETFSTLLTRLKSKSTTCQLADFTIGSNGNMYTDSLDATILINSYSVPSFTKYIDKSIRKLENAYKDDYPELEYSYEVSDDEDDIPRKAYTPAATARLTNVLYMIKTGNYKYESSDAVPEGFSAGDIFGRNICTDLTADSGSIKLTVMSQAYNSEYLDRILGDDQAAAELFGCTMSTADTSAQFINQKDALAKTFMKTYLKVNDISSADSVLKNAPDDYFTPCSWLSEVGPKCDIIHIRLDKSKAKIITNTLMCYIMTKGNWFSF